MTERHCVVILKTHLENSASETTKLGGACAAKYGWLGSRLHYDCYVPSPNNKKQAEVRLEPPLLQTKDPLFDLESRYWRYFPSHIKGSVLSGVQHIQRRSPIPSGGSPWFYCRETRTPNIIRLLSLEVAAVVSMSHGVRVVHIIYRKRQSPINCWIGKWMTWSCKTLLVENRVKHQYSLAWGIPHI